MSYGGFTYGSATYGGSSGSYPSVRVPLQSLSLTLHIPVWAAKHSNPATFALGIVIQPPLIKIKKTVSLLSLTLVQGGVPEVQKTPSLFTTALTLYAPSYHITYSPISYMGPFRLTVSAGFSPTLGSLAPRIVRYIKDPIVTGGCPQCGTYLYNQGEAIESEAVTYGRNNETPDEDDYVRCPRCHFPCKLSRHVHLPEGSKAGWGMRYDEIEAGA